MAERAAPGEGNWTELSAPHLARYLFAAEFAQGKDVLDAGCGCGYGARILRSGGAGLVQGVDIDPQTVASAGAQYGDEATEFVVDDCERLDCVSGPFDVICNFENVEHLRHPERFLDAAARRLRPDGVLLISTPDRAATPPFVNGRPRNPYHEHEWYRDEFRSLLADHFGEVDLRVQVQTTALESRIAAVDALREGLMWANPLLTLLWRKLPLVPKRRRGWKRLDGLAAPSVADYPIVSPAIAPLLGRSWFHVAICRRPRVQPARAEPPGAAHGRRGCHIGPGCVAEAASARR